jgi:hypothetical protein
MGRHGHLDLHGRLGRHGHDSHHVAKVAQAATVAQVATVAPRSSAGGTLLLFNNSVNTAKETLHFTITKISFLTLFKEITAVYPENHTKHKECRLTDC